MTAGSPRQRAAHLRDMATTIDQSDALVWRPLTDLTPDQVVFPVSGVGVTIWVRGYGGWTRLTRASYRENGQIALDLGVATGVPNEVIDPNKYGRYEYRVDPSARARR